MHQKNTEIVGLMRNATAKEQASRQQEMKHALYKIVRLLLTNFIFYNFIQN